MSLNFLYLLMVCLRPNSFILMLVQILIHLLWSHNVVLLGVASGCILCLRLYGMRFHSLKWLYRFGVHCTGWEGSLGFTTRSRSMLQLLFCVYSLECCDSVGNLHPTGCSANTWTWHCCPTYLIPLHLYTTGIVTFLKSLQDIIEPAGLFPPGRSISSLVAIALFSTWVFRIVFLIFYLCYCCRMGCISEFSGSEDDGKQAAVPHSWVCPRCPVCLHDFSWKVYYCRKELHCWSAPAM